MPTTVNATEVGFIAVTAVAAAGKSVPVPPVRTTESPVTVATIACRLPPVQKTEIKSLVANPCPLAIVNVPRVELVRVVRVPAFAAGTDGDSCSAAEPLTVSAEA